METKDREMEEIVRDAHQLIEELRQGNPWERAVKRMASKCFNMGMAAIPASQVSITEQNLQNVKQIRKDDKK